MRLVLAAVLGRQAAAARRMWAVGGQAWQALGAATEPARYLQPVRQAAAVMAADWHRVLAWADDLCAEGVAQGLVRCPCLLATLGPSGSADLTAPPFRQQWRLATRDVVLSWVQ